MILLSFCHRDLAGDLSSDVEKSVSRNALRVLRT